MAAKHVGHPRIRIFLLWVGLGSAGCTDHHDSSPPSAAKPASDSQPDAAVGDAGTPSAWLRSLPSPGGVAVQVGPPPVTEAANVVFDPTLVHTYEIQVDPDDLDSIDADPAAETYVPGMLAFDGEIVDKVGVRYKGGAGQFIAPCTAGSLPGRKNGPKVGKCSLKISFDEYDNDARFHGLKKINLHSMIRDPSLLRERLAYAMFDEMGVASSRTAYARLIVNGELQGIFLAVEQIDGRFTRARFSDGGEGNLYKEVWPLYDKDAVYRAALESNKGDDANVDKILAFARAVVKDPGSAEAWLDRDYTLRYLAVDRVMANDDGALHFYCFVPEGNNHGLYNNHNYYWYEASNAARLWLIPWDLDETFGVEARVYIDTEWSAASDCRCHIATGFPERAPSCDPLVGQWASWRDDYEQKVDDFLNGPFAAAAVETKLSTFIAQAGPLVDEAAGFGGAPDRPTWQAAIDVLRTRIDEARANRGWDNVDAGVPAVPDAGSAAIPDAAIPDAAIPDAAIPDSAVPDAASP
jgi:spore coat protein H